MLFFYSAVLDTLCVYYVFQIEDITLDQLRSQLKRSYGRVGEESVTEAWDSMQTLVRFVIYLDIQVCHFVGKKDLNNMKYESIGHPAWQSLWMPSRPFRALN